MISLKNSWKLIRSKRFKKIFNNYNVNVYFVNINNAPDCLAYYSEGEDILVPYDIKNFFGYIVFNCKFKLDISLGFDYPSDFRRKCLKNYKWLFIAFHEIGHSVLNSHFGHDESEFVADIFAEIKCKEFLKKDNI